MTASPRYPGIRVTANGNQLVSYHTEARIADAGVFYPITPSTEGGELYQQSFAEGRLNVFGRSMLAVEAEGEHAAQGVWTWRRPSLRASPGVPMVKS